jgi:hypothetical protein
LKVSASRHIILQEIVQALKTLQVQVIETGPWEEKN